MSKINSTIEINGQLYDSLTGQLLGGNAKVPSARNVDGIISRRSSKVKPNPQKTAPIQPASSVKPASSATHVAAAHVKGHAPEPAKTLMRTSVSRPQLDGKHSKPLAQGQLQVSKPDLPAIIPKLSSDHIDAGRQARAASATKNQLISRFGAPVTGPVSIPQAGSPDFSALPADVTAAVAREAAPAQPSLGIFEKAVSSATSHQEKTGRKAARQAKRRGRRGLQLAGVTFAFLVVGGFALYQNLPNIHVHMASARAGFSASLPGYRPSGFSLGAIDASAGSVAVAFHSNSDQRNFTITEKPSDWDSQTLLTSFVSGAAGQNYQTVQAGGRTVYIYGKNNATWVNGGIWYQVQTSGALSTQQIIDLASSI